MDFGIQGELMDIVQVLQTCSDKYCALEKNLRSFMTPRYNAAPFPVRNQSPGTSSLRPPKTRISDDQLMASSISSLPYRASTASVSSLFASTSSPSGSRSVSPSGTGTITPRTLSASIFGASVADGQPPILSERPDDPRNLILQAFIPHIAVHASNDTDELVKDKGFDEGLWGLLRPLGERIHGKVTVRDSVGAGRTWDDFAVRFVHLGDGLEVLNDVDLGVSGEGKVASANGNREREDRNIIRISRMGGNISQIEALVDRHLTHAEEYPSRADEDCLLPQEKEQQNIDMPSPFYTLYLRRLLSGFPLAPHETFSHPVACVIAISSRNKTPIEALRRLYDDSSRGDKRLPVWVNGEYLRYYVLVHDEERDDITKSMALFDQMKRHFGLHCHLLRLRSSQCVLSDDDSVPLPRCDWLTASEELADIRERELHEDVEDSSPCIYESDMTAIKTFVREMVTQSIIPSMERCVSTWNDQVASRRRGISGRFISLSKKWTGFGGSSRASSANGAGAAAVSNSNYDALQGFYRPDAPEAIMRKLADYAFMLRDWKLAQSTYDLLRPDFSNDKAWKYHAAANEMAAITTLLTPQAMSSKTRSEMVDQMLETASYSYITRCSSAFYALRALSLGMELLRLRGGSATDDAARWGSRMLEYKVVGAIGDALIKERISVCHASKPGAGSGFWGSRTRKSALWNILAAEAWLNLGKPRQSKQRLNEASVSYSSLPCKKSLFHFYQANDFMEALQRELQISLSPVSTINEAEVSEDLIDDSLEESDAFDARPHRRSLMGVSSPVGLETAPLRGTLDGVDESERSDHFEGV